MSRAKWLFWYSFVAVLVFKITLLGYFLKITSFISVFSLQID